jgi:CheY-like chemotaxis protein
MTAASMLMSDADGRAASPKQTVLVVEDEPFARMYATQLLEDQGFAVIETECAHEAILALRDHPEITLLFSDIRLPGDINGLSLAARARTLRPQLPILLTSGYAQSPDLDIPRRSKFLPKPYTALMLLDTARELVGQNEA